MTFVLFETQPSATMLNNYRNGKKSKFSRNDKQMAQHLPHATFQKYSTWWYLAVFQTVQSRA